jgi:ATP-dependent Clp protease adaptor protein ClpS
MSDDATGTAVAVKTAPRTTPRTETDRPWLWNIVLHDSDEHTYEYVIEMLYKVFGFPVERGFAVARVVDAEGRGVVLTTHREHAELKAEQVRGCGAPLRVSLEPAERE